MITEADRQAINRAIAERLGYTNIRFQKISNYYELWMATNPEGQVLPGV